MSNKTIGAHKIEGGGGSPRCALIQLQLTSSVKYPVSNIGPVWFYQGSYWTVLCEVSIYKLQKCDWPITRTCFCCNFFPSSGALCWICWTCVWLGHRISPLSKYWTATPQYGSPYYGLTSNGRYPREVFSCPLFLNFTVGHTSIWRTSLCFLNISSCRMTYTIKLFRCFAKIPDWLGASWWDASAVVKLTNVHFCSLVRPDRLSSQSWV